MDCDQITLTFQDEAAAARGCDVLRDLVKLVYAGKKGLLPDEAEEKGLLLCQQFFLYRSLVRDYDPQPDFHGFCPLPFLKQSGETVVLDRCSDLQMFVSELVLKPGLDDFFIDLFEVLAFNEPDTPFEAENEYEETVSATIQTTTVTYRDRAFLIKVAWDVDGKVSEMRPVEWKLLEE